MKVSVKITINGVKKDLVFNANFNGVIEDDENEKHNAGLKLTTRIEREVFNLGKVMGKVHVY